MARKSLHTKAMLESNDDFEAAYRAHGQSIYRFLLWRTRDKELSEDLTSSVFEKAWRSRMSFHGGSVQAWLYRIARNSLTDYWRKKKDIVSDEVDEQIDERPSSEEAIDAAFTAERLRVAVDKLPQSMRQVVRLRFIQGLSCREVGERLNINEGNVRIIQYRALKRLRKYLS